MKNDEFDSSIKKIINQFMEDNEYILIKITKKFYKPYYIKSQPKGAIQGRIKDDLSDSYFDDIQYRSPNWQIEATPVKIFNYIVDNIEPKFIDQLFQNYIHFSSFHGCFTALSKRKDKSLAQIPIPSIDPENLSLAYNTLLSGIAEYRNFSMKHLGYHQCDEFITRNRLQSQRDFLVSGDGLMKHDIEKFILSAAKHLAQYADILNDTDSISEQLDELNSIEMHKQLNLNLTEKITKSVGTKI